MKFSHQHLTSTYFVFRDFQRERDTIYLVGICVSAYYCYCLWIMCMQFKGKRWANHADPFDCDIVLLAKHQRTECMSWEKIRLHIRLILRSEFVNDLPQ